MTTYAVTVPAGVGPSITVAYHGNPLPVTYVVTANQVTVDATNLDDFLDTVAGSYLSGGPVPDTSNYYLDRATANATYLAPLLADNYLLGNGTDESAAFQSMLNAAANKTIYFSPGKTYRADSALTHPGGHIRLRTLGGASNIVNPATSTGPTIDLRFAGFRLQCLQAGVIDIDGSITLVNGGTSAGTFILCTLCSPRIKGTAFIGRSGVSGSACDEDAVQLGGTDTTYTAGVTTSAFGGYGGYIRDTVNAHIRRGAYLRNFANTVPVTGCYADGTCGGAATGTTSPAFIEIDPSSGGGRFANGNIIRDNLIEMSHYAYGIAIKGAAGATSIGPNGFWDAGGSTVADVLLTTTGGAYNTIDTSGHSDSPKHVDDHTLGLYAITATRPRAWTLAANVSINSTASFTTAFSTGNFVAKGESVLVEVFGFSTNSTGGTYNILQVHCSNGTIGPLGDFVVITANYQQSHGCAAVITGLTPGVAYTFDIQVEVSAGAWLCRPVAFPGSEQLVVKISDLDT